MAASADDPGRVAHEPAARTQPVLNSQQLRRIAEAVSGYRGQPRYWLVLTQREDGELEHHVLPQDPGYLPNAVVLPCRTPKEADRPHVVSATIRAEGGPELNLLNLNPIWQQVFMGAVILAAVAIDSWSKRST